MVYRQLLLASCLTAALKTLYLLSSTLNSVMALVRASLPKLAGETIE